MIVIFGDLLDGIPLNIGLEIPFDHFVGSGGFSELEGTFDLII